MEKDILIFLEKYFEFQIEIHNIIDDLIILKSIKKTKNSIINEVISQTTSTDGICNGIGLNKLELIMDIEKNFNIIINDDEIENLKTIKDIIDIIKIKSYE